MSKFKVQSWRTFAPIFWILKLYRIILDSPLGTMAAAATEEGVCLLEFSQRRTDEALKELSAYFEYEVFESENSHLKTLKTQLQEYFDGTRTTFSVPLVYYGTDFQKKVWETLLSIPFGKTRSYKQQSILLNNPGAIRAVGAANGANRISILVPCHRVIGEDGSLTGYAGGLHRKKWLLDHEAGKVHGQQLKLI